MTSYDERLRLERLPDRVLRDVLRNAVRERDEARAERDTLREALGALGAMPGGYCFCSRNRDPGKLRHEPECHDAREALRDNDHVPEA